jgi:hypothetical protein
MVNKTALQRAYGFHVPVPGVVSDVQSALSHILESKLAMEECIQMRYPYNYPDGVTMCLYLKNSELHVCRYLTCNSMEYPFTYNKIVIDRVLMGDTRISYRKRWNIVITFREGRVHLESIVRLFMYTVSRDQELNRRMDGVASIAFCLLPYIKSPTEIRMSMEIQFSKHK